MNVNLTEPAANCGYHGLMPGSEYKVIGTLMNKETGEALLKDGKKD